MLPIFLHSAMTGAPVNTNAAGSALGILDACLRTGFNVKTPTGATVSGGVVTVTYAAAHGYENARDVTMANASAALANGRFRITVTSPTTLTYTVSGLANGSLSGSLETRYTPLGWERPFSDTNKAVYRSLNPVSPRHYLRVEDARASVDTAIARGFVSMSDIDTGTEMYPTSGQVSATTGSIYKWGNSGSASWCVIGDDRTFFIGVTYSNNTPLTGYMNWMCFGDFDSERPGDAHNSSLASYRHSPLTLGSNSSTHYVARDYTGLPGTGTNMMLWQRSLCGTSGTNVYPNVINNGFTLCRPVALLQYGGLLGGKVRGMMHVFESVKCHPFLEFTNIAGVTGRVVVVSDGAGPLAFPLDEEW